MKKLIGACLVLLILTLSLTYLFIPSKIIVSKVVIISASVNGLYRVASEESFWKKWWPQEGDQRAGFHCAGLNFSISKKEYNSLIITASAPSRNLDTKLILLELNKDSIAVQWEGAYAPGNNAIERLRQYFEALTLKKCMNRVLGNLQNFADNNENIYGFAIRHTTLKDSVTVSTGIKTDTPPTTESIYALIGNLRVYIRSQHAKETNFPMLNVTRGQDSLYATTVAIATNRALDGNKEVFLKRLSEIPDKVLITEVRGDAAAVERAKEAIETYMTDYHLTSPVIPFQLLITDRLKEKDKAKWITRLYYPII